MDLQLEFLMMWQAQCQPMCDAIAAIVAQFPEAEQDDQVSALYERIISECQNFHPEDPSHPFLLEMAITATHYVNLLYNFGVFYANDPK